ncbi:MAG TPA: PEP-CTERM sorting domain-containing protein [Chthoniobacteraceae bacterium]|nr:PEP-CTERM sorting domain-containing protein [Chthoniobacteraceae bacterium]
MKQTSPPRWISLGRYVLFFCALGTLQAQTQTKWKGGDGDWGTAGNWNSALPTGSYYTDFQWDELDDDITVNVSGSQTASDMRLARSQTLTLEMANDSTLTFSGGSSRYSRIGQSTTTGFVAGTGPAALTLRGPESGNVATVTFTTPLWIQGGWSETLPIGSSLTVTGAKLEVTASSLAVGFSSATNVYGRLEITEGAKITATQVDIGTTNTSNTYNASYNKATVRAGSTLITDTLNIGAKHQQRSNQVEVTGADAFLSAKTVSIGDSASTSTNLGGHSLTISNGGQFKANGTTAIQIYSFDSNGGDNDGRNKIVIESAGTFSSANTIVNRGLLALKEGGVLNGRNAADDTAKAISITTTNGARFEAAGSGLESTVSATINSGGTLAVGDGAGGSAPQILSLGSTVTFNEGAILELNLFETGMDSIDFLAGATLSGTGIKLNILGEPTSSGTWQVFTGQTAGISETITFDLTGLDPVWDTSLFNQDDGWKLTATVVPEPSTLAMLLGAGAIFCFHGRRLARRRAKG